MKKTLIISGFAILLSFTAFPILSQAQVKAEISPFGGYMFGGSLNFYEGKFKIENNANYGLSLNFEVAPETQLELNWAQMGTTGSFKPYYGYDYLSSDFDINVGYIQIGSLREMGDGQVRPFGVFTLGTTYFAPKNVTFNDPSYVDLSTEWRFSVTLGGGAKIWLNDRVGVRLQGNLMLPMFWSSAGFAVGTGGGGFYVGSGTSMVQGDFTGGLIFAIGQ